MYYDRIATGHDDDEERTPLEILSRWLFIRRARAIYLSAARAFAS